MIQNTKSKEKQDYMLSSESMAKLQMWLGVDGIRFFKELKEKYGKVDAVYMDGSIPHLVHFREGMSVRNFLRTLDECENWDAHKLDDSWVEIIGDVINETGL